MSTAPAEVKKPRSRKQSAQLPLFEIVAPTDQKTNNIALATTADSSKKLDDYKQTRPEELIHFELLGLENGGYSNTIELYDFIPKYYWGQAKRINEQFLLSLEREFECRGIKYKVTIHPARIKGKDGKIKDYYPSQREELVEDALRKLASSGQGIFLDDEASVMFTLYQLRKELQQRGHGYKLSEIKDALSVCVNTAIEVEAEDGTTVLKLHIFETVGLHTEEDWKGRGQKTKAFVRFNPLVTNSVKNRTFRQLNYEASMSYRSVIARQLHKRMSHHYIQASLTNTYEIMLSTIIRDFGLTAYKRVSDNLREVELAIKEMQGQEVVLEYKIHKILDAKRSNKLVDAKIILRPHPRFAGEMIKANKRHATIKILQLTPGN